MQKLKIFKYSSFQEYLKDYPSNDYDNFLDDRFIAETKSNKEYPGFIEAITTYAKKLKLTDEELAERFNVSISTFQRWKNESLPFLDLQREITLWINCLKIEALICNQCDKKKIPTEMNKLTCKVCCGEK